MLMVRLLHNDGHFCFVDPPPPRPPSVLQLHRNLKYDAFGLGCGPGHGLVRLVVGWGGGLRPTPPPPKKKHLCI